MSDLTIGLLRKSCLLRESCLGWEGRLLEAATEAGGKTIGRRRPEARRHAHGCGAKGRRWQEKKRADHLHLKGHILFLIFNITAEISFTLKNIKMYIKGILNFKTTKSVKF